MDYSRLISERLWNQPDKGELESRRENEFIDDIVQKDHLQRQLFSNLDGIESVFDGGAGSGRFSIPLAKKGIRVVHYDISVSMIEKAKELAINENTDNNITFVSGALEDLSQFRDRQFDMVISFDSPVSYTYPNQEKVIEQLVRISKKRILLSVSNRLGWLPYYANPIQKNQFILNHESTNSWIKWQIDNREKLIKEFHFDKEYCEEVFEKGLYKNGEEEIAEYDRGGTPWPITYQFMPDELRQILEKYGVKDVELAGTGAYARAVPNEILTKIMNDELQRKDFLDFCYIYDRNPFVCGMGKDNLFAKGDLEIQ